MNVGKKIYEKRTELKMTQDELAKLVGYKTRSSVNKIELGLAEITQTRLAKFAKALNVPIAYFFEANPLDEYGPYLEKADSATIAVIRRLLNMPPSS